MTNKFGLSRHIPENVKIEVRRRSKFGCVICRSLVYEYEHFDPEYKDATEHTADGICLLCSSCHSDTPHRLTKQAIRLAYERVQTQDDVQPPFYKYKIRDGVNFELGAAVFKDLGPSFDVIRYDDEPILNVSYVEDRIFGGYRPSISGRICDLKSEEIARFEDNEITIRGQGVDVTFVSNRLTVKQRGMEILQIRIEPDATFTIDRLMMRVRHILFHMDGDFGVTLRRWDGVPITILLGAMEVYGAQSAFSYSEKDRDRSKPPMEIVGGEGILLHHYGITIAKGNPSLILPKIELFASQDGPRASLASNLSALKNDRLKRGDAI